MSIVTWPMSQGLNAGLSFVQRFTDAGAGAVNLTPTSSLGSPTPTFTRATSAWCWGPTGLLLTVAPGIARSNYTELTGASYLGYWQEEARTNTCIQNRDFTNAAWVKTTMTAAKDQVGIDGVANACSSLLATAGNATAAQTVTIAAVSRPFSIYVKRLVGTGNIDLAQDGASFTTQSVANDGAWHRVTLIASQLNPVLTIRLATNADKIAVDFAALEDTGGAAALMPGTPILTAAVAVTRNIDALTYPTASNFVGTLGSAYAEFTSMSPSGIASVLGVNTPRAVMRLQAGNFLGYNDLTNNPAFIAITRPVATLQRVGMAWNTTVSMALNGAVTSGGPFDGDFNAGANMGVGYDLAGNSLNGGILTVKLWNVALSDGQLAQT